MLMTILKQMKNTNQLANIPKIYESIKDMVYTNISLEQISSLTYFGLNLNLDSGIRRYILEGSYEGVYGHSFFLIDQKKKVELAKKVFGITIPFDKEHDLYFCLKDSAGK